MENLPVEILTVILLWATRPGQRRLRRRVSLVCRTWNTIISQNRLFWTEIGLHRSGKEFQEVLKRNPAGPLDVSWTPGSIVKSMPYSAERLMKLASAESQRWRSLTVAGILPSWVGTWFLQVPTPRLTDINLCLIRRFQRPELPKFHLTPEGYSLRNVVLGYVTLDWDCSRMTGLRSLRIQGLKHNQPTLSQLHTIISSSPELEVLALMSWEWEAAGPTLNEPSLHPMALNFLKTLILDSIDPVVIESLSSAIIAPQCNNLKLHRVGGNMVHDQLTASRFVDLLRGPLREVSGLFLDYNQPRGEIILGAKEGEGSDELGIRAATSKLAKRRGLYFNVSLPSAVQKKSRAWSDLMRTAMRNVFQPALSGLQLPIEFKLRGPPLHPTREWESQELPYAIFLELPLTISLLLFNILATNSVLNCLASPQHLFNADEDTESPARPDTHPEKITILCSRESFKNVRYTLKRLINNRTGCLTESWNGHLCGCQLEDHQNYSIKKIVIRHPDGGFFDIWSKGRWKRLVNRATQTDE